MAAAILSNPVLLVTGGLACLGLLLGIGVWLMIPKRHPVTSADSFKPFLKRILESRDTGAHLFALVRRGPASLQFHVRETSPGQFGIVLLYPRAQWSRPYFDRVTTIARERGLRSRIETHPEARVQNLLAIQFGTDLNAASNFAWEIMRQVYSVTDDREVGMFLLGWSGAFRWRAA
jgi:hypothetical protein